MKKKWCFHEFMYVKDDRIDQHERNEYFSFQEYIKICIYNYRVGDFMLAFFVDGTRNTHCFLFYKNTFYFIIC